MMLITLIVAILLIAALLLFVGTRPDNFTVTRSATLPAPASLVFEQVNDLYKWQAWSPWARMDPNAKNTHSGSPSGVGSVFEWSGSKTGAGRMTIVESRPNDYIKIKLEFFKPFKANNTAEFTFQPEGEQTLVTWSMSGQNNFMAKAFGLFVDCEKMCGDMFLQGLANLKEVTEGMTVNH
jgi:hypothetical protein